MTGLEPGLERLYELRTATEAADAAWFDVLAAGSSGTDEAARYKALKAEYRAHETALIAAGTTETCGRCGGDGVVHYGRVYFGTEHVDRWCFACGGVKRLPLKPWKFNTTAPTRWKHVCERRAEEAAEAVARSAKWDAFAAAEPEVAAFLAPHETWDEFRDRSTDSEYWEPADEFLSSMRAAVLKWGHLTERQMAATKRSMERAAAKAETDAKVAAAGPLEGGTRTVRGEIVSLPDVPAYDGGTKLKALILLDTGHKILGVCSEKFWAAADNSSPKGLLVEMTCTIERSDRDENFGFYKSPKGIKILGWAGEAE